MSFHHRPSALVLAVLFFCVVFTGCASVKVLPQTNAGIAPEAARPQRLVVGPFDFAEGALPRGRRSEAELAKRQTTLGSVLREDLAKALRPLKLEVVTDEGARTGREQRAWRISGQFVGVDEGSQLVRVAVGFGLGASKVETAVKVNDLSTPGGPPVATFRTTSFSGGDPGLILSVGTTPVAAVDAALTLVSTLNSGPRDDTKRTARMIAAYVSELLAERGWLDPKLVRRAKK